jgi:hypothetical protein
MALRFSDQMALVPWEQRTAEPSLWRQLGAKPMYIWRAKNFKGEGLVKRNETTLSVSSEQDVGDD